MDTAAHWFSDLISADLALLQRSTGPGPFWPSSVLRHTAGPGARLAFGKRLVERVHGVLTARGEDPKQALRLRRYFIAAGTSLLALGIFFACYLQRLLPSDAFLQIASAIALAIVIFYLLFSTGINRKSTDPSL